MASIYSREASDPVDHEWRQEEIATPVFEVLLFKSFHRTSGFPENQRGFRNDKKMIEFSKFWSLNTDFD